MALGNVSNWLTVKAIGQYACRLKIGDNYGAAAFIFFFIASILFLRLPSTMISRYFFRRGRWLRRRFCRYLYAFYLRNVASSGPLLLMDRLWRNRCLCASFFFLLLLFFLPIRYGVSWPSQPRSALSASRAFPYMFSCSFHLRNYCSADN